MVALSCEAAREALDTLAMMLNSGDVFALLAGIKFTNREVGGGVVDVRGRFDACGGLLCTRTVVLTAFAAAARRVALVMAPCLASTFVRTSWRRAMRLRSAEAAL